MTVAAIVLAAGASTRLGSPKQLVMLGGETLLERSVRIAREAGCAPVMVILGASAASIRAACNLRDATVVINADWQEGMAASIACGVAAIDGQIDGTANGVIVMACDQPAVTADHLRALIAGRELRASSYAGRHGIPAYFPMTSFEDLLELRGDIGARGMLQAARALELDRGELDLDRPDDVELARRLFGR